MARTIGFFHQGEPNCERCYDSFSTTEPPVRAFEEVEEVSGTYNYDRGLWHEHCVEEADAEAKARAEATRSERDDDDVR